MKATHEPAPTASDPMRPSTLLRGAAIYLGTHGWTKHQFYDLVADTDGPFPPACTSGAIITAATGRCPVNGIFTDPTLRDDDNPNDLDAAIIAMRVFASWIDLEYKPLNFTISAIDVIGDWNDHDERTLTDVIQTLMDAANDWDAAHSTGGAR
jgi:hypothetical protein